MKRLLIAAALLLVAAPSLAAITTINNGDGTTTLRFSYVVPTAKLVEIRDAICTQVDRGDAGTCLVDIDLAVHEFLLNHYKRGKAKTAYDLSVKPIEDADLSGDLQ